MNDQAAQPKDSFTYYGKTPKGVEMALTLAVPEQFEAKGERAVAWPTLLAELLRDVDAELAAVGFTRSDRLDRPAYGGAGGKVKQVRPETPPPDGVVVEEHCDLPMVYQPARAPKTNGENDRGISAHWECRKGRACAEPNPRGYGHEVWKFRKKPANGAVVTGEPAAPPASPPAAQGGPGAAPRRPDGKYWTEFWKQARALGFQKVDVDNAAASWSEEPIERWPVAKLDELLGVLR